MNLGVGDIVSDLLHWCNSLILNVSYSVIELSLVTIRVILYYARIMDFVRNLYLIHTHSDW